MLKSNISKHGRKICAPIFKGKHFIGQNCYESMSWLVLMASWFSIKISSMRSLFGFDTGKNWWKENMCATWKFELKKHLCERRGQLLKKMSKYQNIKIANNSSIKWEVEIALLLTGSKKLWMYQLFFFVFSLRYFVNHDFNSWSGILP